MRGLKRMLARLRVLRTGGFNRLLSVGRDRQKMPAVFTSAQAGSLG